MKILVGAFAVAWFTLFARHALDQYGKRDFRQMWGAVALSFALLLPTLLWNAEEMPAHIRDLVLGFSGAGAGAAALIWLGYAVTGQTAAQNSVQLIPPLVRHELQLKPNAPLFLLMNEEGQITDNQWRVPRFRVKNITNVGIQDARVAWSIDLAAVQDAVRTSPRFEGYQVDWSAPQLTIRGGKRKIAPYAADLELTQSYPLAFISAGVEGTDAALPISVFQSLAFYAAATIHDDTGSAIPPISLSMTISWNLPSPGVQKFRVIARVVNGKPATVQDPELILFVSFDIEAR